MFDPRAKTEKPPATSSIQVETKSIGDDLVDAEPEPFKLYNFLFRRQVYKSQDLDAIATRRSVYDDLEIASHCWPKPEYENILRFDVKARWTAKEERVKLFLLNPTFLIICRLYSGLLTGGSCFGLTTSTYSSLSSLSPSSCSSLPLAITSITFRAAAWLQPTIRFSALNLDRVKSIQTTSFLT
jgi:hypothetical protein